MSKILIESGQIIQVSMYTFLFSNPDNINGSCHLTCFRVFVFYWKSQLLDFQPGRQNHPRMPIIITFRIISS